MVLVAGAPLNGQRAAAPGQRPLGVSVTGLGGARSALTLTYPADPGLEVAAQDVKTLAGLGRWTLAAPVRTTAQSGVFYEAEATPAIGLDPTGDPPLFPFLKAFSRYPEIALVFVGTTSSGPPSGSGGNRHLRAEWTRTGGVMSYNVHVRDASFDSPEEVLLTPGGASPGGAPRVRRVGALWGLLLLGSVGVGVFVWGLTWWLMSLGGSRTPRAEEENPPPRDKEPEATAEGPASDAEGEPAEESVTAAPNHDPAQVEAGAPLA
jgi:hypothetical protein